VLTLGIEPPAAEQGSPWSVSLIESTTSSASAAVAGTDAAHETVHPFTLVIFLDAGAVQTAAALAAPAAETTTAGSPVPATDHISPPEGGISTVAVAHASQPAALSSASTERAAPVVRDTGGAPASPHGATSQGTDAEVFLGDWSGQGGLLTHPGYARVAESLGTAIPAGSPPAAEADPRTFSVPVQPTPASIVGAGEAEDLPFSVAPTPLGLVAEMRGGSTAAAVVGPGEGRSGLEVSLFAAGGVILPALRLGQYNALAGGALGADVPGHLGLPIAELVKESTESLTALVRGLYRLLLGRAPANGEEQGWVGALLGGQTEEQVLEAFLSTSEFDQRASSLFDSGSPDERYVRALHSVLLGRPATEEEVTAWLAALPELGRDGVAACLVRSNEFRALQVQEFYREQFGQPASPADAAQWAAAPFDLLAIREALAARPDLFAPPQQVDATAAR
jgi:hypothetical protein